MADRSSFSLAPSWAIAPVDRSEAEKGRCRAKWPEVGRSSGPAGPHVHRLGVNGYEACADQVERNKKGKENKKLWENLLFGWLSLSALFFGEPVVLGNQTHRTTDGHLAKPKGPGRSVRKGVRPKAFTQPVGPVAPKASFGLIFVQPMTTWPWLSENGTPRYFGPTAIGLGFWSHILKDAKLKENPVWSPGPKCDSDEVQLAARCAGTQRRARHGAVIRDSQNQARRGKNQGKMSDLELGWWWYVEVVLFF